RVERLELLGRDHDVAVGTDLVALHDLLVRHLFPSRAGYALLAHARLGLGVELVEAHVLWRRGAEQLDRHVDQPEADGTAPDRSRHVTLLLAARAVRARPGSDPCRPGAP